MSRVVRQAPLVSFVVLAFVISWAIWSPLVLSVELRSDTTAWVIYYAGVIGPAAAALLCSFLGGGATFAALMRRLTHWKVPVRWYATAILLPFGLRGVALAIVALSEGSSRPIALRSSEAILGIAFLMLLLVPFEEIGWRGYALPLLQKHYTPFASSLILGVVWAAWHLPLAWASVGYQRSAEPWAYMAYFTLTIIPISCLITWLFNRTGESVILVSLLHIAVNLADFVLVLPERAGHGVLLVTTIITALVVAAMWWRSSGGLKTSGGA